MPHLDLEQAIQHLKSGEVLAYPTEAVWGLGCDPTQESAFEKILQLKQRPIEKGVILLSETIERIEPLLHDLDSQIKQKIIQSWTNQDSADQATTWLLPISMHIPPWIYGQHDRVAIRVTTHPLCQMLCKHLDQLLVSTSANPAGHTPARHEEEVQHYFPNLALLPGQLGKNRVPSRIIDAITGQIIRA